MTAPAAARVSARTGPFASTRLLTRLDLRRERIIVPVTVLVLVVTSAAALSSVNQLYGTDAERAALAASAQNAAFELLLGPLEHLRPQAAIACWRVSLFMITATAVCAVLLVTRLTRKEEDLGRVELVRAAHTGRFAPLAAALTVAAGFSVIVGAAMTGLATTAGASAGQAALDGTRYTAVALAATGLAAMTAQIASTARAANLLAVSLVIGGYVLRGTGDAAGIGWLRWTNPVGWAEQTDPYGARHWWPIVACVAVFAVGAALAAWVSTRRDLGSGLLPPRPGPASSPVAGIGGLMARLDRGGFIGWLLGLAVFAVLLGALAQTAASLTSDNPAMLDYLRRVGGTGALIDVFLATEAVYLGFAVATWAVTTVTRMRADEEAGRTEALLATPASRSRYLIDRAALIVAGSVVLLLVSGLLVGGAAAASTGDASLVGGAVAAAAVQVPAALVIGLGALAIYAVAPRFTVGGGWAMAVLAFLLGPLGELFGLSHLVRDISPFTHVPQVPSGPMQWAPIVVLVAVDVALAAVARWRFGRRDIS
ncbi:MAG: ABC transporter permease [Gordonia sp. (in: high G+C Gram-positive bacteria)]|uniref:ABC transporter permease n=1 Tax=Gordonia sp. (in: high G+C Gram-positive bacteria) TaxID=84139 RepID=UPI0039E44849